MYRINVSNWQGDDSALQISNGQLVAQSTGKVEDTLTTRQEAGNVISNLDNRDTCEYTIEEVVNVEAN